MRGRLLTIVLLAGLAACSQDTAQDAAAPEDRAPVRGALVSMKVQAEGLPTDMEVEMPGPSHEYAESHTYETLSLGGLSGLEARSAPDSTPIEAIFPPRQGQDARTYVLHRVTAETATGEAPNGGLCGAEPTTHMMFAVDFHDGAQTRSTMSVAAFAGADAPGAAAVDSRLCEVFAYEVEPD